jgi:hypothetical protein
MKSIYENQEELFEIYKKRFGVINDKGGALKREFDKMMLLDTDYMPYWFVCELLIREYDLACHDDSI